MQATQIPGISRYLAIGNPVESGGLTMVPFIRETGSALRYQLLRDALAAGTLQITEVSDGGHVPEVRVTNNGKLPVLLLDGAALVGAKQNRVINLTVLVAAEKVTVVPVSCVEQGRWHQRSPTFSEGESLHFAKARASKMFYVSQNLAVGGRRHSSQGQVWEDMAAYARDFEAEAPSGAMDDIFLATKDPVEKMRDGLRPAERQVGGAFVANGVLLGIDLFDAAGTFAAEFSKITRSYAVEAIRDSRGGKATVTGEESAKQQAREALALLESGKWHSYPGVGLGRDYRQTTRQMVAGALVCDDEILHLAAFPGEAGEVEQHDDHAPAMPRMRRMG